MSTRTAKGTATDKSNGTTLTVSSVAASAGESIVVGIVYDNSQGNPTVAWGGRALSERIVRDNSTANIRVAIFLLRYVFMAETNDVVATWGANIKARAMFVTAMVGMNKEDQVASKVESTTTDQPGTSQTGALKQVEEFAVCVFGSAGPSSDAAGTRQIEDDDVWEVGNQGQRAGTTGGQATSNVTVQETYLELATTPSTRGRLQSATSRLWVNAILVMRRLQLSRAAIISVDLIEAARIFVEASPDIDEAKHAFHYNFIEEKWELYEVTDLGTLIATKPADGTSDVWTVE